MKRALALLLLALPLAAAPAPRPALPLGDNESLVYHVSWEILPGVGRIRVTAHRATDPEGTPLLRIVTTTSTRGLAYLLLPFEARAESLFDVASGRLLWLGETSTTRTRDTSQTTVFDYAHRTAICTTPGDPPHREVVPMPAGNPTDLITCLLAARTWNLHPGQKRDALVLFKDDFYQLTVHALGYEDVTTPLGTFRSLVLEPRMEETPPKGMFRRGSTVRVGIAQDPPHLPVRFQVHFNFGVGVATLAEYHPPAGKP
jgi:Protein of unknown function (DUF3108)